MDEQATRIYKVDDGVYHWVFAADAADALDVYRSTDGAGAELTDRELEDVRVQEVPRDKAMGTRFVDDMGAPGGTLWTEYESDPSRRYVACSEW